MNVRAIFGLFLGLVIQPSLVQPSWSAGGASHCAMSACCEGMSACPCASNDESERNPAPIAPVAQDLKLSIPKARELEVLTLRVPPSDKEADLTAASVPESRAGFAGVPLSVAFCSFVI